MKMTSFRAKPVGWRGESHRHYLAAKGVKTRYDARKVHISIERYVWADEMSKKTGIPRDEILAKYKKHMNDVYDKKHPNPFVTNEMGDDPDELLFAKKDVKKMAEEEFEKFENELTPFQRRRLDKLRMTGKPYNPGESIQAITIRTRKKMMEDKKKLSSEEFERQYGTQAENVMKGFEDKYLK